MSAATDVESLLKGVLDKRSDQDGDAAFATSVSGQAGGVTLVVRALTCAHIIWYGSGGRKLLSGTTH
jgi:hypothetical protein